MVTRGILNCVESSMQTSIESISVALMSACTFLSTGAAEFTGCCILVKWYRKHFLSMELLQCKKLTKELALKLALFV